MVCAMDTITSYKQTGKSELAYRIFDPMDAVNTSISEATSFTK